MMKFKRTRIAPTPSGFLHLGNILSFALTAGLARRTGASILLRMDDLDRGRADIRYVEDIFDSLRFLGIPWDEGPVDAEDFERSWSQVWRLSLYHAALERLRAAGRVYACSCSRSQLASAGGDGGYRGTCRDRGLSLDAEGVNWRLRTELLPGRSEEVNWRCRTALLPGRSEEGIGGGVWSGGGVGSNGGDAAAGLPVEMRDFVVRKKDGFPAYQLSSVVDDLHYGVDLVVRGEDLRGSTMAQRYLAEVLSAVEMPGAAAFAGVRFVHHPLLTEGGEKLSKSAGATSIRYLRQQGASPADIFTLIARSAGWEEPVPDWERLATLLFVRGYGSGL